MPIANVTGLFETHLTVSDLERSIAFYRDIIGLEFAHRVPDRNVAFLWVGTPGRAMLGLWSIGSSPLQLRLHIAFVAPLAEVVASVDRLRAAGLTPRSGTGTSIDEPVIIPWMPAASVYFDDPDGHSLELIAMLDGAPRPEWSWLSLSEWRRRTA